MKKKNIPWLIGGILYLLYPRDLLTDGDSWFGYLDDFILLLIALYKASEPDYRMPKTGITHFRRDRDFKGLKFKQNLKSSTPHEVLGIPPNATQEQIHAAYKELMAQYHPDKVQHLGEDLQEVAKQKSLAINKAYQELSGARTKIPTKIEED